MKLRWLEVLTDRESTRTLQFLNEKGEWEDVEEVFINNQTEARS
jgi:hypothetical protein